jgi:UDP-glucose 4-epimerase
MSILVTGGAGYIGSHMVIDLLDAGEKVVVIDNLSTGFERAIDKRATFIIGDISNNSLVKKICHKYNVRSVIHLAGSTVVPESVKNPLKYYLNNTTASRTLIEVSVEAGVENFIFSSTAAVYGITDAKPVKEESSLFPLSPYGRSKLMTELMLADVASAHNVKCGVLRYFNVAGADPKGRAGQSTSNATHLIKVACQVALGQRDKLEIFGTDYPTADGTCVRDYIHVTDLTSTHIALLNHLRTGGENLTLNCGYGFGFSVRDVVNEVVDVSGTKFTVRETNRRPGDAAAVVANVDLLKSKLNWAPNHNSLREIVRSALNWESNLSV